MKKLLSVLALALCALVLTTLTACSSNTTLPEWNEGETFTLVIGATPRPHEEILNYIRPYLLADGINLEIRQFTEFPLVNPALADGTLGVNYFQHLPFLEASPYAEELVMLGFIHIEPMGAYSLTLNSIDELPEGATIAIPNDATNHARALLLLQANGLLTVDPDAGVRATYTSSIIDNPLNLRFTAMDAAVLPRVLDDPAIDMAIINTNHVLAGTDLNPRDDSLIIESLTNNPFANGVTVRRADADHPAVQLLLRHLQSERVRDFIYRQYDGAVLPVF